MDYIMGSEGDIKGDLIKNWFEEQAKEPFSNKYAAMGFIKEDKIVAAALFDNYTRSNINFHYYGPNTITRANYRNVLNYVFNFLKCARLTAIVPRYNTKAVVSLPRLGFIQEAILKNYYGVDSDQDGLVYVIRKDRAKDWIEINGLT